MSTVVAQVNMVKQQLRTGNVVDGRILSLFESTPRGEFLPVKFRDFAYSDMQIPLAHEQCMMTPLEEALLLQSLELKGHEVVLEIGTGTGFLTKLLSKLCKKVISVDYYADFTSSARQKLTKHQCSNVELYTGDGSQGWLDAAPYDVIIFSGALDKLTEIIRLQLAPGGKLFAIIGTNPVMQAQLHTLDIDGEWHERVIFETCLPPLIDHSKPKHFIFSGQDSV